MTLYHGTNTDIDKIDLSLGLQYKDFGKGFYLTPDKTTAGRMAKKKARLFGGTATVITYELDSSFTNSELTIKSFPEKATPEWFLFIDANRDREKSHTIPSYDIVIGPIADDGVVLQLTNYREGIYTPEQAAKLLQDKFLDQQYCFKTERALAYLRKISVEIL